ncbi:hypothetical protein BACERE00177_04216 [Bacillus mobilis]|uniref:Uncharacterized protein n=1 Tax=Bacillus cereus TaxID=1396 RepID=A0A1Q4LFW2_BACCE|nr:hypothetical protein BJR06_14085 [Bacillus cereus]OKA41070.1 hypothetical protein BJR07_03910 [Bacillus cereus]SME40315.1 hypothetical protein BACERE00177_04216 [Bacillus mobilis]
MKKGSIRRIFLKEWTFTLVLITIFLNVYIQKTGIAHISLLKLLFIPIIFIVAHFRDKKFAKYAS